jgi:hypothetical protein
VTVKPPSRAKPSRKTIVSGGAAMFQRIFTRLGCLGRPPEFSVEFYPYAGLTHTVRLRNDIAHVRVSDVLRGAPVPVMEGVAAILLARLYRRRVPLAMARDYRAFATTALMSRRMQQLRRKRARHRGTIPQGNCHDLDALYERLNQAYFGERMRRPRLAWSVRTWRRQLGCFDGALGQILLNRRLDREDVPEFAVEYVLYHEMLHQKHPLRLAAHCRLQSHSPAFRREERRFAHYDRAMRFLKRLR